MRRKFRVNINFLDKYLYILNKKSYVSEHSDKKGYRYKTKSKVTKPRDMLILGYLLSETQKKHKPVIEVSFSQMLKECSKPDNGGSYKLTRECLDTWNALELDFDRCFYENGKRISKSFRIIEEWSEYYGVLSVVFNKEFLQANQGKYSTVIPLSYYINLSPLSMRLYEILATKFYSEKNETWQIFLMRLAEKIPLKVRTASDVWFQIKPALEELKEKILPWITWEVIGRGKTRKITFAKATTDEKIIKESTKQKPKTEKVKKKTKILKSSRKKEKEEGKEIQEVAKKTWEQQEKKEANVKDEQIKTLFGLLKRKTDRLKKVISEYYEEEGFEYVRCNICYANENSKKKYSSYLQQSLAKNWAYQWKEEEEEIKKEQEREREEERKKKIEEKERKRKEEQQKKEQQRFLEKHNQLAKKRKKEMWKKARSSVAKDQIGRATHIEIQYAKLVLEHFNKQGEKRENFSEDVIRDLNFIKTIANQVNY